MDYVQRETLAVSLSLNQNQQMRNPYEYKLDGEAVKIEVAVNNRA